MCKGAKEKLYTEENKDSLEGPYEETEIQRKALRREKNLAFMLRKENSAVKRDPKKS